ncbi:unnamed protein product [Brachionus calyciflorus]|uniref:Ig-like domain-containing protein n=1 Tax=Brachionus calyciflorus TaxID=104777 RepID=A0A813M7I6_9BILA|nr:unnamed protein product [Brachionus calyciflorus]
MKKNCATIFLISKFFVLILIFEIESTSWSEWSQWSQWSTCSAGCGYGKKVKNRTCLKPPTKLGPNKTISSCLGTNKIENMCKAKKLCVVNGAWSEWSSWTCDTKCGIGIQKRKRYCNEPPPSNNGEDCVGFSEEVDVCFQFGAIGCLNISKPYNNTPLNLKYLVLNNIKLHTKNLNNQNLVNFKCNQFIIDQITRIFKSYKIMWIFNGTILNKSEPILTLSKQEKKSGIYLCAIRIQALNETVITDFYQISSQENISDYRGNQAKLPINFVLLKSILKNENLIFKIIKNSKEINSTYLNRISLKNEWLVSDTYQVDYIDNDFYKFVLVDSNIEPKITLVTNEFGFNVKEKIFKSVIDGNFFKRVASIIIVLYILISSLLLIYEINSIEKYLHFLNK